MVLVYSGHEGGMCTTAQTEVRGDRRRYFNVFPGLTTNYAKAVELARSLK